MRAERPSLKDVRVFFLLPSFGLAGAERQAFLLAKHLRRNEQAHVHMLGLSKPSTLTDAYDAAGLQWSYFELQHAYRSRMGHARDLARFVGLLRRSRVQVLLSYCMFQNVLAALTWRAGGVSACVWNQRDEGRSRLERWIERIAVGQTTRFVSNSRHGAEFLVQQLGAPSTRVSVVQNGIEVPPPTDSAADWRARFGIPPSAFVACMVANLHEKKDHATLIAAWREVVDRVEPSSGTAPHLLLAGVFGDRYQALLEQVAATRLEHCVHFLGEVRDIDGLLASVDFAVFSSFNEGVPNAVLEAMARGLAVVGTDYCGIREAVGPDGTWLLAEPRNSADLADKILLASANPERRRMTGALGRERVHREFGVEKMTSEMTNIIAVEWERARPERHALRRENQSGEGVTVDDI